jgi:DNA-binding transcriptional LysR family regulator
MTFTQLNIFKTIVETESFTKTADVLHITQSGVSHSLASLEDDIGIKLIKANKRGILLTEAGENIYKLAKDILNRIDRSKEEISALKNLQTGKLKLGCFQSASVKILPGILKLFKRKYPGIEVSWFLGTDLEVAEWVKKDIIDIGFVVLPAEGLETIFLFEDKMLGVFPEKHPLCSKKYINIKELVGERLITFRGSNSNVLVEANLMNTMHNLDAIQKIEATNISAVIEMIKSGIGAAVIPKLAVPVNYSGICSVHILPEIKRDIALASRSFNNLSLSSNAFIDITKKWLGNYLKK